jgi:carbonic anhydrase
MPNHDWFEKNRLWSEKITQQEPGFFRQLAKGQAPRLLWIGCSDSRVTPDTLLDVPLGTVFTYRNVANLVTTDDVGLRACVQFALTALNIRDIAVCGHYLCGGVCAAIRKSATGDLAEWLRPLRDLYESMANRWTGLPEKEQWDRLCEVNVVFQVLRIADMPVVRTLWAQNENLQIYGWIFDLETGHLQDLAEVVASAADAEALKRANAL